MQKEKLEGESKRVPAEFEDEKEAELSWALGSK